MYIYIYMYRGEGHGWEAGAPWQPGLPGGPIYIYTRLKGPLRGFVASILEAKEKVSSK